MSQYQTYAEYEREMRLREIYREGEKRLGCCYAHSPTGVFDLFLCELGVFGRKLHFSLYFTYVGPCLKCHKYKRNRGILGTGLNVCLYARKQDADED